MSALSPRLSKTGSRRFSRDGFVQLEKTPPSNDVTVDIPMAAVGTPSAVAAPDAPTSKDKSSLFRRHTAGRRVRKTERGMANDSAAAIDDGTVNQMGRLYNSILSYSFVTRYIVYILPLAILIAIPIVVGATAARKAELGGVRIVWLFTWLEIVWLSLWVAKVVARMLPALFQFLCGIVSPGTRKYALVLKQLEIPLSLVGWALASLATFIPMMTRNPDQRAAARRHPGANAIQPWQHVIQQILAAALISSLVFAVEKALIQLCTVNYHRRQFEQRIMASKRHVHLLGLLFEASRTLFPAYCSEFAEEDYLIHASAAVAASGTKRGTHQRSGSATPMRLLHNVGRVGDKITAAFGNMASEITGKQVFNPTSAHSVVVEALEKRRSSEALAKRLWMSFVVEGRDALYVEDIVEVLGLDRQADAEEAFATIDRDGNGDISLDEMQLTTVEFGRERHAIATSLADVDQAINVLDNLLCTIVFIVVVFIFLAFLNASFSTTLATAGAALLSMSFAFATTVQEVLGSCIFLFVKHPYDVGDRVDIANEQLTVEHISLLFSVFKKVNCHKTVQIPHLLLNNCWIDNISRSKGLRELVTTFVNFDTSLEDIHTLRTELQAFVLDKEHNRDFQPVVEVEVVGIGELNKLELKIEMRHKSNWSNEAIRAARRSKFMFALVQAMRRIPIYGPGAGDAALGDVHKPTYAVTITDAEAAGHRAAFAADKDAKRLFPQRTAAVASKADGGARSSKPESFFGGQIQRASSVAPRPLTADTVHGWSTERQQAPMDDDSAAVRDGWDSYREEMVTPGGRTVAEARRSNDVQELRGLLHRQPTTGRRKAGGAVAGSMTSGADVRVAAGSTMAGGAEVKATTLPGITEDPSSAEHALRPRPSQRSTGGDSGYQLGRPMAGNAAGPTPPPPPQQSAPKRPENQAPSSTASAEPLPPAPLSLSSPSQRRPVQTLPPGHFYSTLPQPYGSPTKALPKEPSATS
ncbi:MAG: hypothetical protein M1826_006118 [Phylliscum demangeonii]|nr:MAG: hypothetical protein M1826_006118 [Phylliscum demangeonii]